jgi:hypothetical protein
MVLIRLLLVGLLIFAPAFARAITIPVSGASDVNCPSTIPSHPDTDSNDHDLYMSTQTCATGANAAGYDVTSISLWIATASAGGKLQCSVYNDASPHVRVEAGCNTGEYTTTANPNAYVTIPMSGTCHLAASTRYYPTCWWNFTGAVAPGYAGTGADTGSLKVLTYDSSALPANWTESGANTVWFSWYLTATATGGAGAPRRRMMGQ